MTNVIVRDLREGSDLGLLHLSKDKFYLSSWRLIHNIKKLVAPHVSVKELSLRMALQLGSKKERSHNIY